MNNLRFLKIAIIVLAALNVITLGYLWFRDQRPPRGPEAGIMLSEELDFSEEQQEKFRELKHRHHAKVDSLRNIDRRLHRSFFDMLSKNPVDSFGVETMAKEMATLQAEIEKTTFFHFVEVRGICNPSQQEKFDHIIHDVLKQMHKGPRPGSLPPKNR